MVYEHAVVAAFRIYAQCGEVAAKREGWSPWALNSHGNYIAAIMEKSWNCVFEFLWEPCVTYHQLPLILTALLQVAY